MRQRGLHRRRRLLDLILMSILLLTHKKTVIFWSAAILAMATILVFSLPFSRPISGQESDETHLFLNPREIKIDAANKLIYVFNRNTIGITVLDAKDYSLVNKIFIDRRIADIYINNETAKIYAIDYLKNKILIFDALSKEELKNKDAKEISEKALVLDLHKKPTNLFVNEAKKTLYVLSVPNDPTESSIVAIINSGTNKIEKYLRLRLENKIDPIKINSSAFRVVYSAKQDKIYFIDRTSGGLWLLNLSTGIPKRIGNVNGLPYLDINNINDKKGELYVPDYLEGAIGIVDTRQDVIISSVPLSGSPFRVFYNQPLNKIFVLSWQTDDLTIIDPDSKKIEATIDLGVGADPTYIVIDYAFKRLFVMNGGANTVSVVDVDSRQIIKTFGTPPNPSQTPEINLLNNDIILPFPWAHVNALFVIKSNYETMLVPPAGDSLVDPSDFFASPIYLAVHKDKGYVYVLNNIGGSEFRSKITAIDAEDDTILWMAETGKNSRKIAVDSSRNKLYVNNADENTVSVINALSGKIIKSIPVGAKPRDIIIDEETGKVFVANSRSNSVSVINTSTDEVENTINTNQREPYALFYDPFNKILYVASADYLFAGIKINEENRIIYNLKLSQSGGLVAADNELIQASPDFNKIYVMTVGGSVYLVKDGALQTIIDNQTAKRWVDAISDKKTGKIYIADAAQNSIEVLDSQTSEFKNFFKLKYSPSYLALEGSKLFVATREGFLEIINTGSKALEASVSMAKLPANIVFNPRNQRIYLSYSSFNSVASFDINQNKVASILQNKTAVVKKPGFLTPTLLIGGFAAIFGVIAIWWILRKKSSFLNKIKI